MLEYGLENPTFCVLFEDSIPCEMLVTRNKLTGCRILMAKRRHQNVKVLFSVDLCCTFSTGFCVDLLLERQTSLCCYRAKCVETLIPEANLNRPEVTFGGERFIYPGINLISAEIL